MFCRTAIPRADASEKKGWLLRWAAALGRSSAALPRDLAKGQAIAQILANFPAGTATGHLATITRSFWASEPTRRRERHEQIFGDLAASGLGQALARLPSGGTADHEWT
jgi:hypothetical protein